MPTAKNGMVKDFYQQFGFAKVDEDAAGKTRWRLGTSEYRPQSTFMKPAETEGAHPVTQK